MREGTDASQNYASQSWSAWYVAVCVVSRAFILRYIGIYVPPGMVIVLFMHVPMM